MNQLDILCFTLVSRTRSFSATARELRITQQAVSRHIKTLEDELGLPLFLRSYQNVQLTKAGEQMLQYFEAREALVEDLRDHFQSTQDIRRLRIACSQWLGIPQWFQRSISAFSSMYPEIRLTTLDLNAEELDSALKNKEIDLLLTTRYTTSYLPAVWNSTVIGQEQIMLIGSKRADYDFEHCSLFPFFATYAGESGEQGVLARVQRECEFSNIYPRRIEVCPNMGSACLNILVGGGLTLGVGIPPLLQASEFLLRPTGRYATVVLCRPFCHSSKEAELFEQFLIDQREDIT